MPTQPNDPVKIGTSPGSKTGVNILKVTGPLTIYNFFEFQDFTRKDKSPILIIDLGEVPYMDSAALGCLLGVHVSCEKNQRKYAVVNLPERLKTMFSMAGVSEYLTTYPSVAEAETALT
jgi:anti-anti-sigma factor